MKILAFDTSGTATSVAIADENKVLVERTFDDSMNHSTTLMPTIDKLMREINLSPHELTRIAVAQGPGSYTGLRIAVTAAKTLAYALELELVGVSSLQTLTFNILSDDAIVVPLMNARRGNVYAAAYHGQNIVLVDQHVQLTDFLSVIKTTINTDNLIFTGDASLFIDEIYKQFPASRLIKNTPSAAGIARLATQLQPVSNIHNFNPVYLKKVEAEERWEAENGTISDNRKLVSKV